MDQALTVDGMVLLWVDGVRASFRAGPFPVHVPARACLEYARLVQRDLTATGRELVRSMTLALPGGERWTWSASAH